MPRYLLTIYQPDGPAPDAEVMARLGADLHRLNQDLRASGSWVVTGGLHGLHAATVVRGDGLTTSAPTSRAANTSAASG